MSKLILTKEQAVELIGDRESIHTLVNPSPSILIGCDYSRKEIMEAIEQSHLIEVAGESAKSMGHGIVIWTSESNYMFVEVDAQQLNEIEK
jgi:hypothetical protein